jgi:hypothetical protein
MSTPKFNKNILILGYSTVSSVNSTVEPGTEKFRSVRGRPN